VRGLVLATQERGGLGGEPAEHHVRGIDHVPGAGDLAGLGAVRGHGSTSSFWARVLPVAAAGRPGPGFSGPGRAGTHHRLRARRTSMAEGTRRLRATSNHPPDDRHHTTGSGGGAVTWTATGSHWRSPR